jgi:capsular polysaccharide biosynthesis protein
MKIIFFYIGTPSPVFETELELIHMHEKTGDQVRVIQCSGNLPNCHWNLKHVDSQCAMCNSKFKNGWNALKLGKNVELKQFETKPKIDTNIKVEFDTVEDVKKYKHDNENIGYGVTATLISLFRDHRFDTKKHSGDIARTLSTSIHVYDTLKHEINDFSPDLVYFFNGRIATHLPAKLLCKKLGIEYYSYEVSGNKNAYRLLKNKVVHDVLSNEEIDQLHSNWSSENIIFAETLLKKMRAGKTTIAYTQDQKLGVLPKGFDKSKKNIAIYNGTIDEYAGIENAKNKIYKPDETTGIYRILESFENDSRFFFYLRVHPHMKEVASTTSQLVDIRELSLRFSNVHVIWPDEDVDSYALLDACEKVITFGSTVGIEATYWGKPSILADHATYERLNYAYLPNNHNELVKLVKGNIKPLSIDGALKSVFLMANNSATSRELFKEKNINNRATIVTLGGNEIRASVLPRLWYWLYILPSRLNKAVKSPALILKKIKCCKFFF